MFTSKSKSESKSEARGAGEEGVEMGPLASSSSPETVSQPKELGGTLARLSSSKPVSQPEKGEESCEGGDWNMTWNDFRDSDKSLCFVITDGDVSGDVGRRGERECQQLIGKKVKINFEKRNNINNEDTTITLLITLDQLTLERAMGKGVPKKYQWQIIRGWGKEGEDDGKLKYTLKMSVGGQPWDYKGSYAYFGLKDEMAEGTAEGEGRGSCLNELKKQILMVLANLCDPSFKAGSDPEKANTSLLDLAAPLRTSSMCI